jgi:hypothetical protein
MSPGPDRRKTTMMTTTTARDTMTAVARLLHTDSTSAMLLEAGRLAGDLPLTAADLLVGACRIDEYAAEADPVRVAALNEIVAALRGSGVAPAGGSLTRCAAVWVAVSDDIAARDLPRARPRLDPYEDRPLSPEAAVWRRESEFFRRGQYRLSFGGLSERAERRVIRAERADLLRGL